MRRADRRPRGSLVPEARATRVAAGIPMMVTAAAAATVAHDRCMDGIWELAPAHISTVAAEPHVPGPGLRRPIPKKVAIKSAHKGGRDVPGAPTVGSGSKSSVAIVKSECPLGPLDLHHH